MPARKYKTDPSQLLAEGRQIVDSTKDDKYRHKVEMVNLVLGGLTPSYLSAYCADSKRTITLWAKIADEQGFEALKPKKPTGRPPRLTKEQKAQIRAILEEDDPKKYGQNVWDGPSLSSFIEKTYAIKYAFANVKGCFTAQAFRWFGLKYFPAKANKTNKSARNIKKLKEIQSDSSAVIVYQDEVHFQVTTSVTRKWVVKGSGPKVKSAPSRKSVPYSGYIVPQTGELIVSKPSWFNYETVIESFRHFLQTYPIADGKRAYLILDNAPWHKKAVRLVQTQALPEYQDIRDKMIFIFLPPYSPDLNPTEQVWRITRREVTHNTYFPNDQVLEDTLDLYFAAYRQPNNKLASLCAFKCNI